MLRLRTPKMMAKILTQVYANALANGAEVHIVNYGFLKVIYENYEVIKDFNYYKFIFPDTVPIMEINHELSTLASLSDTACDNPRELELIRLKDPDGFGLRPCGIPTGNLYIVDTDVQRAVQEL